MILPEYFQRKVYLWLTPSQSKDSKSLCTKGGRQGANYSTCFSFIWLFWKHWLHSLPTHQVQVSDAKQPQQILECLLWDEVHKSQISRSISEQAQTLNLRSIPVVCYCILCIVYTFNPNFEKYSNRFLLKEVWQSRKTDQGLES